MKKLFITAAAIALIFNGVNAMEKEQNHDSVLKKKLRDTSVKREPITGVEKDLSESSDFRSSSNKETKEQEIFKKYQIVDLMCAKDLKLDGLSDYEIYRFSRGTAKRLYEINFPMETIPFLFLDFNVQAIPLYLVQYFICEKGTWIKNNNNKTYLTYEGWTYFFDICVKASNLAKGEKK